MLDVSLSKVRTKRPTMISRGGGDTAANTNTSQSDVHNTLLQTGDGNDETSEKDSLLDTKKHAPSPPSSVTSTGEPR